MVYPSFHVPRERNMHMNCFWQRTKNHAKGFARERRKAIAANIMEYNAHAATHVYVPV